MLQNFNQPKLSNSIRLAVQHLMKNIIEATILTGKLEKFKDILIPRNPMITSEVPFEFKRLHFPVRLTFAMTINKSQGQTLQACCINLRIQCSLMANYM